MRTCLNTRREYILSVLLVKTPCQNRVTFSTSGVGDVAIRSIQCPTPATHGGYHGSSRSSTAAGMGSGGDAEVSRTRSTAWVHVGKALRAATSADSAPKPARRSRWAASAEGTLTFLLSANALRG